LVEERVHMRKWLSRHWKAMLENRSGAAAVLFGVCSPVLFLGVAASVDYTRLVCASNQLQQAVDQAALQGARELVLANMTEQQVASAAQAAVYIQAASVALPGLQFPDPSFHAVLQESFRDCRAVFTRNLCQGR
jgi:Flp pilus assembly protein TadG